jgi:hypothetical protein
VRNNNPGQAVFDNELGMLDSLDEDYTMELEYDIKPTGEAEQKLKQEVRVEYHLKRLAPPLE